VNRICKQCIRMPFLLFRYHVCFLVWHNDIHSHLDEITHPKWLIYIYIYIYIYNHLITQYILHNFNAQSFKKTQLFNYHSLMLQITISTKQVSPKELSIEKDKKCCILEIKNQIHKYNSRPNYLIVMGHQDWCPSSKFSIHQQERKSLWVKKWRNSI
jgi:hypothetical protein